MDDVFRKQIAYAVLNLEALAGLETSIDRADRAMKVDFGLIADVVRRLRDAAEGDAKAPAPRQTEAEPFPLHADPDWPCMPYQSDPQPDDVRELIALVAHYQPPDWVKHGMNGHTESHKSLRRSWLLSFAPIRAVLSRMPVPNDPF